eukprot:366124-Chlamydomonas_euryale.AAC.20
MKRFSLLCPPWEHLQYFASCLFPPYRNYLPTYLRYEREEEFDHRLVAATGAIDSAARRAGRGRLPLQHV